jgi:hypothetical protein
MVALPAGCGSSSKSASPPVTLATTARSSAAPTAPTIRSADTLPDPCKLITQQQAEAAIGSKLDSAKASGHDTERVCTFTGPTTGPLAQVEVFVGAGAKKFLDIDKQLKHEFSLVTGVGDEATIENGTVFFRKGTTWVALRVTSLEAFTVLRPRMEGLARQAVAAIPT